MKTALVVIILLTSLWSTAQESFKIRKVQEEVRPHVCGYFGGYIGKKQFMREGISLSDTTAHVITFHFSTLINGKLVEIVVKGSEFTGNALELISQIPMGGKCYVERIVAERRGEELRLPAMTFRLIQEDLPERDLDRLVTTLYKGRPGFVSKSKVRYFEIITGKLNGKKVLLKSYTLSYVAKGEVVEKSVVAADHPKMLKSTIDGMKIGQRLYIENVLFEDAATGEEFDGTSIALKLVL